ncbi:transporter [Chitinophaga sp. CB10]|uniref:transporter n=1 Tax=Chitinophaga sp. CB10 TaxID=1891659 RepID=UPI0025C2176B|nr:transporter [Chitinophaga sp. CB10]
MMKRILLILTCLLTVTTIRACDICGCGVGSYYLGILPDFSKRFAGLRYQHKTMQSHLGAGGATSYLTTAETYQTAELWGGWNIGQRFRVLAFVPFNFNGKTNEGVTTHQSGLGDIAAIGFYNVFSNRQTVLNSKLLVQSLWVGAGVKAPTGRYYQAAKIAGGESPNNFQLGTGSTDFTLNAMYDIRLMDAGINANLSYKINTANRYDYRYGNKYTANLLAYYKFRIAPQVTVSPDAGVLYETAGKDMDAGLQVDVSGGYALMGTVGAEVMLGRVNIGGNFQPVIKQQLADMHVKAGSRMMVHATVLF